ncbi:hypothetical protein YC2023_062737 [Brassica napus]
MGSPKTWEQNFKMRFRRGKTGGDTSIQGMHRKIRSLVHVPQSYHIEINAMVQYWSLDSACHLRGIKLSSRGRISRLGLGPPNTPEL